MPLAYDIVDRTLANGLRVVVNEDHSVPTVAAVSYTHLDVYKRQLRDLRAGHDDAR